MDLEEKIKILRKERKLTKLKKLLRETSKDLSIFYRYENMTTEWKSATI